MKKWRSTWLYSRKSMTSPMKDGMVDEQVPTHFHGYYFETCCSGPPLRSRISICGYFNYGIAAMACSINVGGLALHCFCIVEDNMVPKYDKHKAGQTGEKVHDKHLYDNPFNPLCHFFVAGCLVVT